MSYIGKIISIINRDSHLVSHLLDWVKICRLPITFIDYDSLNSVSVTKAKSTFSSLSHPKKPIEEHSSSIETRDSSSWSITNRL